MIRASQTIILLVATLLGLVLGYWNLPGVLPAATLLSTLFMNLLKLVGVPIVFLAITATISGMSDLKETKRLGLKVFSYTLMTTLLAATVALGLYLLVAPAKGAALPLDLVAEATQVSSQSYLHFVTQIVPSNAVAAFQENNVIAVAFIALLMGVGIHFLPNSQKELLHRFFQSLFALMLVITGWIIKLMPLGVLAFTVLLAHEMRHNFAQMQSLFLFLLCVVGANLFQGLVVLPLLLRWKKIAPYRAFKGALPALTLAFFSKSSNAALPVALQVAQNNLGVRPKIAQFSLPLCTVINMNGCAAFILTTVLFVSTMNGLTFGPGEYCLWILLATVAAIGNAGVPMGCFFLTSTFLLGMKVPLHIMGWILPFYSVLDMIETALNVWSDTCVTLIVDKESGEPTPALDVA